MANAGPYLTLFFVFLFIVWVIAAAVTGSLTLRRARRPAVPDGPEDEPYRIYTTDHDLELSGVEVVDALPEASRDREKGHLKRDPVAWKAEIARTNELLKRNDRLLHELQPGLRAAMAGLDPADVAVALLIDQSGSMRGEPVANAAATADLFARSFSALGVRNEVLGFSTAGWHGGHAFEAWKNGGRPPRPGRLCALLHVIYKSAEEPGLTEAARDAITYPGLLRENVDGEAVLWAQRRLAALPARHRLMLVLSDGAPVDDATLTHNGPSILHRHIQKVVRDVEAEGLIVGGVGINYGVHLYYPRSEAITALDDLPGATVRVLERLLREAGGGARVTRHNNPRWRAARRGAPRPRVPSRRGRPYGRCAR